jgi:hypothetical protein
MEWSTPAAVTGRAPSSSRSKGCDRFYFSFQLLAMGALRAIWAPWLHCFFDRDFSCVIDTSAVGLEASRLFPRISIIERRIHWRGLSDMKRERKKDSQFAWSKHL